MILVFCLSNLFVPATLTIINREDEGEIMVYTYESNIYDYFKTLDLSNVILYLRPQIDVSKPLSFMRLRRSIFYDIKKYGFKEVFFFHNSFGGFENWLIYKLASESRIFFWPIFNNLNFKIKYTFRSLFHVFISRFIYRAEVNPLWNGQVFIYKMNDTFFNKLGAIEHVIPIDHKFINKLLGDKTLLGSTTSILLLIGSIVELNQVDELEYTNKIDRLIENVGFNNIIVKAHPRYSNKFSLEYKLDEVPAYVPANVLLSKYQVVIGYTTSVVTEAAEMGLLAISLVDYFVPQSVERKNNYKDYLLSNLRSGHIHFPKTIAELLFILENHGHKLGLID
jgi:hypothetical protein